MTTSSYALYYAKTMSAGDVTSDCRTPHNMGPSDCASQSGTHIILGRGPTRTATHTCTFAHRYIYIYIYRGTQHMCIHLILRKRGKMSLCTSQSDYLPAFTRL